jgi:glycosyltransferase involved in cell wall biosynthesis
MIIVHIAPITWNRLSGLTISVPSLVSAQNSIKNIESALLVTSGSGLPSYNLGFAVFDYRKDCHWYGGLNLPTPFDRPDLVVFHSTYIPIHVLISKALCRRNIPYIITPRGGMTRTAQTIKKIKKKIANFFVFKKMVRKAVAIHCLTNGETNETTFWNQFIFVVGNGTEIPDNYDVAFPGSGDKLKFVFIGRIDPYIKGLDLLVEACSIIKEELICKKVQILFYGPDYEGGMDVLTNYIKSFGVEKVLKSCGPIAGADKKKVLKDADLFLHTSRSEGHPMGILEALAYGIPCLLTPGTNMASEVAASGAGWQVEPNPDSIADGLRRILNSRTELAAKGRAARQLAEETFSWHTVAEQTINEYKKILASDK